MHPTMSTETPLDAAGWLTKALAEEEADQLQAALASVEQALGADGAVEEAWRLKASLLLDLELPLEAEAVLQEAVERLPRSASCWFELGAARMVRGDHPGAVECLETVYRLDPDHPRLVPSLAQACLEAGLHARALELFKQAREVEPGDVHLLFSQGLAAMGAARFHEALGCFDKALAAEPGDLAAQANRSLALARLGKPEEALKGLEPALAQAPDRADLWSNRGLLLEELNLDQQALEAFDRAIQLEPGNLEVWEHKIGLLLRRGRAQEAHACRHQLMGLLGRLKAWAVCLVDPTGAPVPGTEIAVQTDLPAEGITEEYSRMLVQGGRRVAADGIVDGQYRIALWQLPAEGLAQGS